MCPRDFNDEKESDDKKRASPMRRIDRHGGDDGREGVIDRPFKRAAIEHQFDIIMEHMRDCFGQMFAILITALPHHVQKQMLRCAASIA
ncbi:MAG TPA: hypothetical protein VIY68_15170 [Steroidobacteraceae bacterium]